MDELALVAAVTELALAAAVDEVVSGVPYDDRYLLQVLHRRH